MRERSLLARLETITLSAPALLCHGVGGGEGSGHYGPAQGQAGPVRSEQGKLRLQHS